MQNSVEIHNIKKHFYVFLFLCKQIDYSEDWKILVYSVDADVNRWKLPVSKIR